MRGCYLGSNVSYNVKKMVENGYLTQQRSLHDRRSIHVRLTEKGIRLRDRLTEMHRRHAEMLPQAALSAEDLQERRRHAAPPRAVLDPRRRLGAAAAAIRRLIFLRDAGALAAARLRADQSRRISMAPQLFPLGPGLSAAGRLDRADIDALAAAGVRTIINNRPDGEDPGQLPAAEARRIAEAHGIAYHHIPITAATLSRADVDAFAAALRDAAGSRSSRIAAAGPARHCCGP